MKLTSGNTLLFSDHWEGVRKSMIRQFSKDDLAGEVIVLTGVFDDVPGDIKAGRDAMETLLRDLGATIKGCVSNKTTILLVGWEPGAAKIKRAREIGNARIITPGTLFTGMMHDNLDWAEAAQGTLEIDRFSGGKDGNALDLSALTGEERAKITGKRPRNEEPSSPSDRGRRHSAGQVGQIRQVPVCA